MTIRDALVARSGTRRFTSVEIDGIGTVWLQSLTEGERTRLEKAVVDHGKSLRTEMIKASVVDGSAGPRLFGDDDDTMLDGLDAAITVALGDAVSDHVAQKGGSLEKQLKN